MNHNPIVSREEWLVARQRLLIKEKELTRARDALNAERRELPMVKIDKDYTFEGTSGRARLLDLFEGRRQLIIHHFMFDPSWDNGCPSCTHFENDRPHLPHLYAKDTSYAVVSRAPLAKIEAYKQRMGWTVPWYSSFGSDFNYDFHVTSDEAIAPVFYNYRTKAEHEQAGTPGYATGEQPGVSVFLRDGDRIFHTYSTFARGVELLVPTANYLDLTPLGRQDA
jgi:predicted dithiol-disulfide oxidoreductase (DUF899 family)